jgi:hypothetical protein
MVLSFAAFRFLPILEMELMLILIPKLDLELSSDNKIHQVIYQDLYILSAM